MSDYLLGYSEGAAAMAREFIVKHDDLREEYVSDAFGYMKAMDRHVDTQSEYLSKLQHTLDSMGNVREG